MSQFSHTRFATIPNVGDYEQVSALPTAEAVWQGGPPRGGEVWRSVLQHRRPTWESNLAESRKNNLGNTYRVPGAVLDKH